MTLGLQDIGEGARSLGLTDDPQWGDESALAATVPTVECTLQVWERGSISDSSPISLSLPVSVSGPHWSKR